MLRSNTNCRNIPCFQDFKIYFGDVPSLGCPKLAVLGHSQYIVSPYRAHLTKPAPSGIRAVALLSFVNCEHGIPFFSLPLSVYSAFGAEVRLLQRESLQMTAPF